jgi:hypothetical protein
LFFVVCWLSSSANLISTLNQGSKISTASISFPVPFTAGAIVIAVPSCSLMLFVNASGKYKLICGSNIGLADDIVFVNLVNPK